MSFRTTLSRFALAVVLCSVVLHGRSGIAEEVLKNEDVVKMVAAGLSEQIIAAKVREAPRVHFQVEVDDLVALRKAGVTDRVVSAMLDRSKQDSAATPDSATWNLSDPRLSVPDVLGVSLKTTEGTTPLRIISGTVGTAGYGPFVNTFMNYPGTRSPARTRDRHPVLLVRRSSAPEVGRYFFAKLDSDRTKEVRSLKLGKFIRRKGPGGRFAPDGDWVIPFDISEESSGVWRVTAKTDLEPGEYGWYVNLQSDASQGVSGQGGGVFDFGVD